MRVRAVAHRVKAVPGDCGPTLEAVSDGSTRADEERSDQSAGARPANADALRTLENREQVSGHTADRASATKKVPSSQGRSPISGPANPGSQGGTREKVNSRPLSFTPLEPEIIPIPLQGAPGTTELHRKAGNEMKMDSLFSRYGGNGATNAKSGSASRRSKDDAPTSVQGLTNEQAVRVSKSRVKAAFSVEEEAVVDCMLDGARREAFFQTLLQGQREATGAVGDGGVLERMAAFEVFIHDTFELSHQTRWFTLNVRKFVLSGLQGVELDSAIQAAASEMRAMSAKDAPHRVALLSSA